ncbi:MULTISPECIES: TolC family protein [Capnocytophaga]|uniref:Outer membrane efflux protein n=1 Tax=Capnocytophaga canis TaxID=1848903 RepID=A0A0B7I4K1_9FLAO|nr:MULTISPECIES: TolC family protein [Capnocytophaga]ATA72645.1 TolC family protein [Capnocytophaga sp. H4358]ATA74756.1 TolC family protein [Capnocytophaga sp. H2931]RIY36314.1 TolC family protein [Capnocytophaga canis]CEN44783.1 Outer membrane efflux protein [Capnocytophaga canis]GIM61890.1 transporter [Capnocytophaga canis]
MRRFIYLFLFPALGYAQTLWTLEDCINHALEKNISIKQSEIDLSASDVDKLQARGAFVPSLNSNMTYSLNEGKNINPVTNQFENTFFQSASGGVSMDMTLFAGLRNWRQLKRAELGRMAAQYNLEKMKDDIVLMVINAYLDVLSNKEQLKNLKIQSKISKQQLERTKDLIEAGSLPKGDVYEAESQVFAQEQQIIATENMLFISKMGLAQLLLLKDYQNFEIADTSFDVPITDVLSKNPNEIFQRAKEVVQDIKIAQANVELAENSLRLSKSAYSPRLAAQWGYNTRWSKSQAQNFLDQLDANKGMYAGLGLSIPILNGFSTKSNIKRQQLNLLKAEWNKEQAVLNLERTVYQAYTDASNARKLFEASEKTMQAKEQSYLYSKERHDVGLMTTFDFNQAKTQYENAENEYIRAKYKYIFKIKVLQYYFGEK